MVSVRFRRLGLKWRHHRGELEFLQDMGEPVSDLGLPEVALFQKREHEQEPRDGWFKRVSKRNPIMAMEERTSRN